MTKNLTTPSIFSRKYGLLSVEEAEKDAKKIEELAFAVADQHYKKEPDGDGSSAVQVYAKESSKVMLGVIKRGPRALGEVHGRLNEVDMSTNAIRRAGARLLTQAVVKIPRFKLLNINGNFISDEGIDEVKELFKSSPDKLGPLDENDPEGEDYDDEDYDEDEENAEDGNVLNSKLKDLKIEQEE
ncbi:RAN GTPase-activating protein 2 [Hibiscus syriacus]|uniref:RAN GTPase-activating protein 2 n=1 Tax=Hibiscus syriacus TaxID=106335 RepID=A0A6A2WLV3_HIBSY|nr:RAN GTPase-activating protein 2 [Hibiscus syriacus]